MIVRTIAELGHLIRDARDRAGLTQAQLAARAGVSRKWLNDFETGKRSADVVLVLRTLKALGLELDVRSRPSAIDGDTLDINVIVDGARDRE